MKKSKKGTLEVMEATRTIQDSFKLLRKFVRSRITSHTIQVVMIMNRWLKEILGAPYMSKETILGRSENSTGGSTLHIYHMEAKR